MSTIFLRHFPPAGDAEFDTIAAGVKKAYAKPKSPPSDKPDIAKKSAFCLPLFTKSRSDEIRLFSSPENGKCRADMHSSCHNFRRTPEKNSPWPCLME